jgi:hypothetical protein
MAVKYLGNGRYQCLEADTKPTGAATNAELVETDTRRKFLYNGTNWFYTSGYKPAQLEIYKIGSTYYLEKNNGTLIDASGTLETVFQSALTDAGDIHILNGSMAFSAGFAGLEAAADDIAIYLDTQAYLEVPQGYTGHVIRVKEGTSGNIHNFRCYGGNMREAGTPQKLWTGFLFETIASGGVYGCSIRETKVWRAKTALHLKCTAASSAINGNVIDHLWANECLNGVDFESTAPATSNGINRNQFNSVILQDSITDDALYGFKNIRDNDNVFISCKAWDLNSPSTQKTATIHAAATNTIIIGGIMNVPGGYFIDNSPSTIIIAPEWGTLKFGSVALVDSSFVPVGNRRKGSYNITTASSGDRLLGSGMTNYAGESANTAQMSTSAGLYRTRTTVATTNSGAGNRYTLALTQRGLNPVYRIKFRLNQTASISPYFGWTSSLSTDASGDDPLNALSGVILTSRKADTNLFIGCNDGTGVTTFTDTGIPRDTTINTFVLEAQNAETNKWRWSLNNAAWTELTDTNIPAATTALTIWNEIQTGADVTKSFDLFAIEVETI